MYIKNPLDSHHISHCEHVKHNTQLNTPRDNVYIIYHTHLLLTQMRNTGELYKLIDTHVTL